MSNARAIAVFILSGCLLVSGCQGSTPAKTTIRDLTCDEWAEVDPDRIPLDVWDYCSQLEDIERDFGR